ncbi:MAG: hypothetical protein P4N59_16185, partial [Negativicutes bacterium]|nr:hypothetical protein [Negativicutes bacterium]
IPFTPFIHEIVKVLSGYLEARVSISKAGGGGTGESAWERVFIGITTPGGCECIAAGVCSIS